MAISNGNVLKRPKVVEETHASDSDDSQSESEENRELESGHLEIKEEVKDDYLNSSTFEGESFTAYSNDEHFIEIKEEEVKEENESENSANEYKEVVFSEKKRTKKMKSRKAEHDSDNSDDMDDEFGEGESEEDEANFGDDEIVKEEGEEDRETIGSGLANVMAKILGTKKSEDIILSKAKTDREVKKSKKVNQEDTFEIVDSTGQVETEPMVEKIKEEEEEEKKPSIFLHDREVHIPADSTIMEDHVDLLSPPSKRRKPNWGDEESLSLAQLYMDEVHALKSSFKMPGVSNKRKHEMWERIATQLNTDFKQNRTALEVKKRWFTISSKSRQKLQDLREYHNLTGGGLRPSPLDPIDKIVGDILGEDNKTIMGEPGIHDLLDNLLPNIEPAQGPAAVAGDNPATGVVITADHNLAGAPTITRVSASAQEMVLPPMHDDEARAPRASHQWEEVGDVARAQEAAARAQEAAARAQEAVARAQEAATRAQEAAARSQEATNILLKQLLEQWKQLPKK